MRCRRGGVVRRTTCRRDARDDEILPGGQDKSALSCRYQTCFVSVMSGSVKQRGVIFLGFPGNDDAQPAGDGSPTQSPVEKAAEANHWTAKSEEDADLTRGAGQFKDEAYLRRRLS